jgi:hypothetical protein
MPPLARSRFRLHRIVILSLGALSLGTVAQAQVPCATDIFLYVEKSSTAATADTTRAIFTDLQTPTASANLTIFTFAGEVSAPMVVGPIPVPTPIPTPGPTPTPDPLAGTLDGPGSTITDLSRLVTHITNSLNTPSAGRRIYILVGDFSHASAPHTWSANAPSELDRLRESVVKTGNSRLLVLQSRELNDITPEIHQSIVAHIAENFPFFEDRNQFLSELRRLLTDTQAPLETYLDFKPEGNPVLTVANPNCTARNTITYEAREASSQSLNVSCPTRLAPKERASCPIDPATLSAALSTNGCSNTWIQATANGVSATAPKPIVRGNCIELDHVDHDLNDTRSAKEFLEACKDQDRVESPPKEKGKDALFATCFWVRGHLEADATITISKKVGRDGVSEPLVIAPQTAASFNRRFLYGGSRPVLFYWWVTNQVARDLCLAEPILSSGPLLEVSIQPSDMKQPAVLHREKRESESKFSGLWQTVLLPLVVLLFMAYVAANHLKAANISVLADMLAVVGIGIGGALAIAVFASSLDERIRDWAVTRPGAAAGIAFSLIFIVYQILIMAGLFDVQHNEREDLANATTWLFRKRKQARSIRWWFYIGVSVFFLLLLPFILMTFVNKKIDNCHFEGPTEADVPFHETSHEN